MTKLNARSFCVSGAACLLLAGCFNGGGDAASSGQDAGSGTRDAASSTPDQARASVNSEPTISGAPPAAVAAGTTYTYQPVVRDADGDSLQFSISGKPEWATFSVSTGLLTGVPSAEHAGDYANIVISVTDGKSTTSLPAFDIAVAGSSDSAATRSAVLSWQAPAHNADATPIDTDLAGYRVYHGFTADSLTQVGQITTPDVSSYVFDALISGTHFFAVSTYTLSGVESALSAIVSKTIP